MPNLKTCTLDMYRYICVHVHTCIVYIYILYITMTLVMQRSSHFYRTIYDTNHPRPCISGFW